MADPTAAPTAVPSDLPTSKSPPSSSGLPKFPFSASSLPQDPFYPRSPSDGPVFLDEQACVCVLRSFSDSNDDTAWRCLGNSTSDIYEGTSGKWFAATNNKTLTNDTAMNDASNPPKTDNALIADPKSDSLVPLASQNPNPLSPFNDACTAINETLFSTAYYNAAREIAANQTPVDAAPCWRAGAIPVQIQNLSSWQQTGCYSGFYCP